MSARQRLLKAVNKIVVGRRAKAVPLRSEELRKGLQPGSFLSLLDTISNPISGKPLSPYLKAQQVKYSL